MFNHPKFETGTIVKDSFGTTRTVLAQDVITEMVTLDNGDLVHPTKIWPVAVADAIMTAFGRRIAQTSGRITKAMQAKMMDEAIAEVTGK